MRDRTTKSFHPWGREGHEPRRRRPRRSGRRPGAPLFRHRVRVRPGPVGPGDALRPRPFRGIRPGGRRAADRGRPAYPRRGGPARRRRASGAAGRGVLRARPCSPRCLGVRGVAARSAEAIAVGYLTADGLEASVQYLAATYPAFCQAIVLPETSVEGRTSRALKIASGGGDRRGVLFLGGVHAREVVNPDLLVSFAFDLCQAYADGTGLTFGPESYSAGIVKLIVEGMDVFVFPLVNPDGRAYVQAPGGDVWWRKNRRLDPTTGCYGVDINRNYDLLWSSGIGTSSSPCDYHIYKGPSAFSEPETWNVRWLLDTYPNIMGMIDVHSYSDDILYPWGDADDQTTDPSKNFQNPAYNGLRGVPGSAVYGEYIPQADLDWYTSTGDAVQAAIKAVRGTVYTMKQSIGLYPTSATSDDYSYSRHFVDRAQG